MKEKLKSHIHASLLTSNWVAAAVLVVARRREAIDGSAILQTTSFPNFHQQYPTHCGMNCHSYILPR